MLSGSLLLKLPKDWQLKMHNEILSKLHLCISDADVASAVADNTWRYLSQESLGRNDLADRLQENLAEYALDFSEWVIDFCQKSIEYYLETVSGNQDKSQTEAPSKPAHESHGGAGERIFKKAIKEVSPRGKETSFPKTVDPLNDTLDNLIKKQKIAKLQGMGNAPLGVQTKSGKFKPQSVENGRVPSKGTFFKNATLGDPSAGPVEVVKVPKICINFPNCQYGDKCRYIHPLHKICKNLPNCPFGDKCAFIHPSSS